MSAWIVYSKDGTTERCRLKKLEYSGSFMNERTVTATFECESEVAFDVFDYIEYRGEKFELEAIPSVKKTSSHNYEYELRFVSLKYELERCEMRDIVPNDNGIVYPTPLTFSFTGDVAYLAERIQANLDALYGTGVWSIVVAEGVTSEDKNITISQQNCWNALSLVNTTYELDFTVKGRVVTIGGNKQSVSHIFQYGKGNGLYEIERSADTETGIVTKLRAYGGTKNLDYSYPKKPEWSDSILDTSFVLSPLRLMLPSFKKDGKTDYIMADDSLVAKYGIREASVIYEDIYPSITGATNSKGEAIDEIKAVDDIDDSKSTFVIHLHDLGFDLEENLTTANAQVSMKTGAMQGYTFNIADNGIERLDDGSYKLTLGRITASSSDTDNFDIPNSKWNMKAGDKFVFLNILMPQEYIRSAENRLLERAKEYLAEYAKTNFSYNVGLHDKFLKQNQTVYNELIEGSKLSVYDEELGISEDVTIQSISITENMEDNILPQVKVTLNNKPSASTLDRIQGQIKELSENASNSFSSQSELLQQYRRKLDKPFFDRLFVAVGTNGKELASTDTTSPIAYIKAKYSFVTVGGVTMYAQDGSVDIPSIAEGLPFDGRTIWFNPKTNQIEVIGGTGGGEGVSNFWDLSGIPLWITNEKPTYSYSEIQGTPDLSVYALASDIPSLSGYATEQWVLGRGYALSSDLSALTIKVNNFLEGSDTDNIINKWKELESFLEGLSETDNLATILGTKADKTYVDSTFVTIAGTEDVTGVHNFVNGLMIGGMKLFKSQDDVVYLDGNLVVRGGVTMYALDKVTVDSIIENLPTASTSSKGIASFDSTFFTVDANGKVSIIPDSVGLNEVELDAYLTQYKYATHDWVTSQGYLKAHQTIHSLTIKRNGTELGVYTPNSSAKDVDIIVPTKVSDLDNDSKFINGITSTMVTDALGYTPYNAASFTKANIKSTLGISDWALATIKPSYKTSEVTEENNLYFTNARAVSALKSITDGLATDIATKWTQDDNKIANWDTAYNWGDHSKNDYTTNKYVNDTFVTIGGNTEQTITGEKNFIGGLKVNGSHIYYDTEKKYWKLEGDLLVTGGVTMYGTDSDFVPSTIMDAILYDDSTLGINANGELYVKGSVGGGTVSGDYLPLVGGTLYGALNLADNVWNNVGVNSAIGSIGSYKGQLAIKSVSNNSPGIAFFNSSATHLGSLQCSEGILYWRDNIVLNTNNYSSYALPLTGGQLSGTLVVGREDSGNYTEIRHERDWTKTAITSLLGTSILVNDYNGISTRLNINSDLGLFYTSSKDNHTAKYPLLHSGNYSSYALPLSGGTLSGDLLFDNINHNRIIMSRGGNYAAIGNNYNKLLFEFKYATYSTYHGLMIDEYGLNYTLRTDNGGIEKYKVWNEYNDGSGSGLDADLLDGLDSMAFFCDKGASNSFNGKIYNGAYRTSSFTPNGAYGYGLVASFRSMETCAQIYFPDGNAEPQFRMQWNSQTSITNGWTALVTSSSIGNYNAGSATRIRAYTHDSGDKVLLSGTRSDNTYERCIYDNGLGLMLKRSLTNTVGYIATIDDNVASATKLYTARTIWGQSFDGTGNIDGIFTYGYIRLENTNEINSYSNFTTKVGSPLCLQWESSGNLILCQGGGMVGIHTKNPSRSLVISNNGAEGIEFEWSDTNGNILTYNRQTATYLPCTISASIVNIGVANRTCDLLVRGGVTMYSARKLKNIQDERGLSLEELSVIKPTRFTWKDRRDNRLHIGGIADDVMKVLPEVIYKTGEDDTLTMDYGNAAFAISASLIKPVVNHEERIRMLEEENKKLKEEVEQLKWNIA